MMTRNHAATAPRAIAASAGPTHFDAGVLFGMILLSALLLTMLRTMLP